MFGALGGLVGSMLGQRNGAPNPGMIQPRPGMMGAGMPGPSMHGGVGIAGSMLMPGLFGGGGNQTGVPMDWRQLMQGGGNVGGMVGGGGMLRRPQQGYKRSDNLSDMIAQFMQRRMQTTPMEDGNTYSPLYQHLFKM